MTQLLIIIHGMGQHTTDSFKKEVVNGCNNALKRYESYKNVNFDDKVDIESIGYDEIFESLREEYAGSGKSLKNFISDGLGGSNLPGFVGDLAEIEESLGEDKFIYTHVLDVIFYLSLVGEKVRLHVAEQIIKAIRKYPAGTRINILAHSLGTAVMHDTLHKLYSNGYTNDNGEVITTSEGDPIHLNPHTLPIDTLWTFANVSSIITQISKLTGPFYSIVKPEPGGCIGTFLNAYHELDPFTLKNINRFSPQPEDNWISEIDYQTSYKLYKTDKVARINTHSIGGYVDEEAVGGYLEDPLICHDFLGSFFEFNPSEDEKTAGDAAYLHIEGEAVKIKEFVEGIDDIDDLKKLVKMLKKYKEFLGELDF